MARPIADATTVFLPAAPAAASAARGEVARLELGDPAGYVAGLLLSELVANSVRHAGLRSGQPVAVRLVRAGGRLRVEVVDRGHGFTTEVPASASPDALAEGGYGLALVERLADAWGVRDDGTTTVWFELALQEL